MADPDKAYVVPDKKPVYLRNLSRLSTLFFIFKIVGIVASVIGVFAVVATGWTGLYILVPGIVVFFSSLIKEWIVDAIYDYLPSHHPYD